VSRSWKILCHIGTNQQEKLSKARWQKNCEWPRVMIRVSASLLLVLLIATACSTSPDCRLGRFHQADQANLVVRYYSDNTSYVLKPAITNASFLTILGKNAVLDVAKQQPRRELAAVILVHYEAECESQAVRKDWASLLRAAGYQRVVFLRAPGNMQINGLPIVEECR
jgi:hypothetical protein